MEIAEVINNQFVSFEDIKLLFRESDKKFQETERIIKEMSQETEKMFQETDKKFKETEKMFQENAKETKKLKEMIFGIGYNNGDVAEDFFYNVFSATKQVGDVHYDFIDRNRERRKKRLEGEYDIILVNANNLLVVEVKYKLHPNDVTKFAKKNLPNFKELFPEYKNYTVYGAVATFALPPDSYELAVKYGLQIFTQSGDGIKNISPEGLKCSVF